MTAVTLALAACSGPSEQDLRRTVPSGGGSTINPQNRGFVPPNTDTEEGRRLWSDYARENHDVCGKSSGPAQKRLNAYSSTGAIEWFLPWGPAIGMDDIMQVMKARAASNNHFRAQIVMQTADVRTDQPNAPVQLGAVESASSGLFDYNPGVIRIATETADAASGSPVPTRTIRVAPD